MIMNAIIGYTGFVGNILKKDVEDCDYYNSKNIKDITYKKYSTIFCCGISALRWWANQNPEDDYSKIESLLNILKNVKCDKFVLISTIAIHDDEPYGKNRKITEDVIQNLFKNVYIFRLPSVYGRGLKKNLIFDILNNNLKNPVNLSQSFQWYNVDDLYYDILKIDKPGIYELYPESIENSKLLSLFDKDIETISDINSIGYKLIKPKEGFIYDQKTVLKKLKIYIDGHS